MLKTIYEIIYHILNNRECREDNDIFDIFNINVFYVVPVPQNNLYFSEIYNKRQSVMYEMQCNVCSIVQVVQSHHNTKRGRGGEGGGVT